MPAKIIKRAEVAASQTKRQNQKPSCPNSEVKKWIEDYQTKQPTQASARRKFADLFTAKSERR